MRPHTTTYVSSYYNICVLNKCRLLPGPSYKGAPSEEVVEKGMDGVGVGRGERGGTDRGGGGVDVVNVSKFEY